VPVIDKWLNTGHWRNYNDNEKLKRMEKVLFQCHCAYCKSHMEWPSIEPGFRSERLTTNLPSSSKLTVINLVSRSQCFRGPNCYIVHNMLIAYMQQCARSSQSVRMHASGWRLEGGKINKLRFTKLWPCRHLCTCVPTDRISTEIKLTK